MDESPPPVVIALGGDVAVVGPVGRARLRGEQPRLVLAQLALAGHQVSREELADLLWPGGWPDHWAGAVRGVLAKVRAALVEAGLPPGMLRSEAGTVSLDLPVGAVVDRLAAAAAVAEGEAALAAGDVGRALLAAERAAPALALTFLPGDEGTWAHAHRLADDGLRRRRRRVEGAALLQSGRTSGAIALAEAAVDEDPLDEGAHRLLIQALAAAGERPAALRAYERCRAVLDDHLGVRPSAETEALHLLVLGDAPATPQAAAPAPSPLPRPAAGPFVGRAAELDRLLETWVGVTRDRRSRVVVVEGEAGAGKTRLAAEAVAVIAASGGGVLWGRCSEDGAIPYEPLVEALDRRLRDPADVAALGWAAAALAPILPGLSGDSTAAPADGEALRAATFGAVAAAVAHVSAEPALLVIDDLQWAGVDTLDLLGHTLTAVTDRPLLAVLCSRSEPREVARLLAGLQRSTALDTIALAGLGADEVASLLEDAAVVDDGGAAEAGAIVHRRTGGNPFFVHELVRSAQHDGGVFDPWSVPEGLRQWIDRRVTALDPREGATLALAATIGIEVDVELLERCTKLDEGAVLEVCEDLVRLRFLEEAETPGLLAFPHVLVRDAVLASLGATRRALLHRTVGEALEGGVEAARPALLAHHFSRAGAPGAARAARHTVAAGKEALAAAAWATAIDHFEDAAVLATHPLDRVAAQVGVGRALRGAGRRVEARAAVEEALGEARDEQLTRPFAEAVLALVGGGGRGVAVDLADAERAALLEEALAGLDDGDHDDDPVLADLLGELALALFLTDRVAEREALTERAVVVARASGDRSALAVALLLARTAMIGPDHDRARLIDVAEVLRVARAPEHVVAAHLARHEDLLLTGDRAGARRALASAAATAGRLGHDYWTWVVATWQALDAVLDGRLDEAEAGIGAAFAGHADHPEALACYGVTLVDIRLFQGRSGEVTGLLAGAADDNPQIPCYRAVLALCHAEAGQRDEAEAAYRFFAADDFTTIPHDTNRLLTLAVLADVAATLDDAAGAARLCELLLPHAGRQVVLNCFAGGGAVWGPVSHQLARLTRTVGDHDRAAAWFEQAAEEAATFETPLAAARIEADTGAGAGVCD